MYGLASGRAVDGHRQWFTWIFWLAVLVSITLVLLTFRDRLDKAHITLAYLLVVLGGSAASGRALGLTLAGVAFLLFNYLFLPPYHTLVIADPLDWLVLVAFLVTGIVAAELLNRVQERAEIARARAVEVDRFATLGAETLSAGRAEDALLGIAEVMRSTLGVDCCEILAERGTPARLTALARAGVSADSGIARDTHQKEDETVASLATWVATHGAPAAERMDGTAWVGTPSESGDVMGWQTERGEIRVLLAPLMVRERTVGVLRVAHARPITLDPAKRQFLSALSYYAALGVERVRLVAEAERAEAFRQADALKSQLIGTVSHDLRTPLTTIK
ncbi:MAG: DUF4118 domain-containing protein, partial [Anaerolineae bacterium]|nr:DUF4118 domain-containing protein [Gemmatimonadaceae bacterium]